MAVEEEENHGTAKISRNRTLTHFHFAPSFPTGAIVRTLASHNKHAPAVAIGALDDAAPRARLAAAARHHHRRRRGLKRVERALRSLLRGRRVARHLERDGARAEALRAVDAA